MAATLISNMPVPSIFINAPSSTTLPLSSSSSSSMSSSSPQEPSQTCYLCDEQNPGDFHPTTKFLSGCLLCARPFCLVHKDHHQPSVCNINHSTYYHQHPELHDRPSSDADAIFPSLGEREIMMMASTTRNLKAKRPGLGQPSLTQTAQELQLTTQQKQELIEVRDVVGADIAV